MAASATPVAEIKKRANAMAAGFLRQIGVRDDNMQRQLEDNLAAGMDPTTASFVFHADDETEHLSDRGWDVIASYDDYRSQGNA